MFLDNKYSSWYSQLISKARNRKLTGYVERHHVVPRSLGGESFGNNLVELTAREHFVCHALLVKMTEGQERYKMVHAFVKMGVISPDHKRYVNSALYEFAKREASLLQRDPVLDKARRDGISKTKTGKSRPPLSEEWKAKIGASVKALGLRNTEEHNQRISEHKKNFWASGFTYPILTCDNCGTLGKGPNMSRYHFSNCKKVGK
jgi:hypothetical protein